MSGRPRPGQRVQSVTLVERKAEARDIEEWMRKHRLGCVKCGAGKGKVRCSEYKAMAGRLAAVKEDIKGWFGPGEDQESLFPEPPAPAKPGKPGGSR